MKVDFGGEAIKFVRFTRFGSGPTPRGQKDAEPALIEQPVRDGADDGNYDQAKFVSLVSPNVLIAALDVQLVNPGVIVRVGWANIIITSSRSYHYGEHVTVTESVEDLPTWDGEAGQLAPYYFGNYYGEAVDGDDGCLGSLDDMEQLLFNDAPCLPPSRGGAFDAEEVAVGLFERKGVQLTSISGKDVYLACLVVERGREQALEVAWSIAWDVNFTATVRREGQGRLPVVQVAEQAQTRVGVALNGVNATELVNQVRGKQASATRKTYTVE